jgi:hypothetical protein
MTTEPQSPLSETEKRVAFLAELQAERERRIFAGKWSRGPRPILTAIVDNESEEVAKRRAFYAHLAMHPDAPKLIHEYDWILQVIVDPKPQVELPSEQYAPDHVDAVDVTPVMSPWRPPMPAAPPPEPPAMPKVRSNAGIPPEVLASELRRLKQFHDGDWGGPDDGPILYHGKPHGGW